MGFTKFLISVAFIASLTLPAASSACIVSGRVMDPAGNPLEGAVVSLAHLSGLSLATTRSGQDGSFALRPIACESYLLSVSFGSFSENRRQVVLDETETKELLIRMSLVPVEEHITVSAEAGGVEPESAVSQRITVVPRSTIVEQSRTVLTEVARGQSGVHEQRTAPAMGSFFIRGLTGKNVSVYRDGFRYSTSAARGGVSTFQNLVDPALLDSVEFVRGPGSAQYGSDSMGGTVNLQSTFPLARGGRWSGELALLADWASAAAGGHLLTGYQAGGLQVTTTLAGRRVNRVRPARGLDSHSASTRFLGLPSLILGEGRLPDTGFTQYGGSVHAQYHASQNQALVAHYERGQQDGAKRYDQLLGGDGNLIADLRNLMMDFGYLKYHRFGLGWIDRAAIGASYHADREERVNQGGQGNPLASILHQYERLEAVGLTFQLATQRGGVLGGEGYRERVSAPAFSFAPATGVVTRMRGRIPDGARYLSHGTYVQDVWRPLPRLRLSGALRFGGAGYQSYRVLPTDSLTANAVTGRIGASANVGGPVTLYAHYGLGYRAPNITDLGTLGLQGNGLFEANSNDLAGRGAEIGDRADDRAKTTGKPVARLRPEVSGDLDLGVSLNHRRVRAEVTVFRLDLDHSIVSQTLLLPQGAVGQMIGDQVITRQLASGAVFVPASTSPVLVRGNLSGARLRGVEQSLRVTLTSNLTFNHNLTWIEARDRISGLPPDMEPGIPPLTVNPSVLYTRSRFWIEAYSTLAGRQDHLSSLALSDRRIGAARSRANIAAFFENGARARGLVANGRLIPTGEALSEVQNRVLGSADSAPLFTAIPGYALAGLRVGIPIAENGDFFLDVSNITDKPHRGIGWGVPGDGRSVTLKYRCRF